MAAAAIVSGQNAASAGPVDGDDKVEKLDSVVVSATRADQRTPVAFTMVGSGELRASNPINSLPMSLNLQPSVVTYNEGGTGLGNSSMTIRGSKDYNTLWNVNSHAFREPCSTLDCEFF